MNVSVLIVDDDLLNLKLLSDTLSADVFKVYRAQDADEAMIVLESVVPQLILLDICLPGMDGISLARKIKRDERLGGVKVVALTGLSSKSVEEQDQSFAFDGWLTKPIDPLRLPEVLVGLVRSTPIAAAGVDSLPPSSGPTGGAEATSAHDMRCRLNGIIGFSELLLAEKAGPLTEKQRRYLTAVLTSGKELLQLVDTL